MQISRVALDVPLHRFFDYLVPDGETLSSADIGLRVRVPFGRKSRIGIVVDLPETSDFPVEQLKTVEAVLRDLPALPPDWFRLSEFCAAYYQAPLGEVMLSTVPAGLRRIDPPKARTSRRLAKQPPAHEPPELTAEQAAALATIADGGAGFKAYLLHGVTGSGKTEVYLRLIERTLAAGRQVLLLVPEINLTPQLGSPRRRAFSASRAGQSAQRTERSGTCAQLARRARRYGTHRAWHALGNLHAAARARTDRR